MSIHWRRVEDGVRAIIREVVGTGRLPVDILVIHANNAMEKIAMEVLEPKSRIVVQWNNGAVTLAEQDGNIPEQVGLPAYQVGLSGAVYLRFGLYIDAIYPLQNSGTDAAPSWNIRMRKLDPMPQEHINAQTQPTTGSTIYYGMYPYTLVENGVASKTLGVWFRDMFDYSAADDFFRYEFQYRRLPPPIEVTYEDGVYTYTQPYFFYFDQRANMLIEEIAKRAMVSMGDTRFAVESFESRAAMRLARQRNSIRGNLDELPVMEAVEEPLRDDGIDM